MNRRLLLKCIELCRTLKCTHQTGRAFHISCACTKNRIVAVGWNDYGRLAPPKYKYVNTKGDKGSNDYVASRHSELHLLQRLGEPDWSAYEIVNVRIDNKGKVACARPCANCLKAIVRPMNPKHFYYSDDLGLVQPSTLFVELETNTIL